MSRCKNAMNNDNYAQLNKGIQANVLEKIRDNELTMRSNTYFAIKLAAFIVVVVALLTALTLLFSFILFSIRASGEASLIGFGSHGFALFIGLFPWKLLFLNIALILLCGLLLRSFRFGYKTPVSFLFLGIVLIAVFFGLGIDEGTSFHDRLLRRADNHRLPFFNDLYEGVRVPPPQSQGVYRGTIVGIEGNVLTVNVDNPLGIGTTTSLHVIFPDDQATSSVKIGDRIFIAGEPAVNGEIHASGIRNAGDMPLRQQDQ